MKEHGILMSAPMARAYLANLKTQTRRTRGLGLINENPDAWEFTRFIKVSEKGRPLVSVVKYAEFQNPDPIKGGNKHIRLPYGYIGDRLYFKETYALGAEECVVYRANYLDGGITADSVVNFRSGDLTPLVWKPSIFMRRKYARAVTPVVNVRVERLQDITTPDAYAEGCPEVLENTVPLEWYQGLWDELNAKRGLGWDKNPWVWIYEFLKPEDIALQKLASGEILNVAR